MRDPRVSLVTVTYNSAATLEQFWSEWPRDNCEWIVVDNNSSDDSAAIAESLAATVIRLDQNVGFSAANNIGARRATGDVLGFVNPDVTATDDGVERLAATVRATGSLVAPQLLNADGSLQENGRAAPYPIRKLAHMFAPGSSTNQRYVRRVESGHQQVVWAMGAAIFVDHAAFERLGGWDEGFFIYYEDSDFCLRALRHGMRTIIDGDVRFVHGWARETASKPSVGIFKHELRSAVRFYAKHPECLIPVGREGARLRRTEKATK